MKRALVPGVLVLLLALSGCVGAPAESNDVRDESAPVASGSTTSTDGTVEPLTAETPAASEDGGEAAFLEEVRANLRPDNVIPNATDEQLLAAGRKSCELRAAGETSDTISVIDGEEKDAHGYYRDSVQIVQAAATTIC